MLDNRPRASDRTGREHRRAGLPRQIARRLGSGQVAVETAQTDAKLADLAEERLDGVPMPRHAETIGHASEVVDPLCCLAVRHRGPIIAEKLSFVPHRQRRGCGCGSVRGPEGRRG